MDDFQLLAVKKNTKVWSSLVVYAVAIRPLSLEEEFGSEYGHNILNRNYQKK